MATTPTTPTTEEPELELSLVLARVQELERSEVFQAPDLFLAHTSAVSSSLRKALSQAIDFFRTGVRKLLVLVRAGKEINMEFFKEQASDFIDIVLMGIGIAHGVFTAVGGPAATATASLLVAKATLELLRASLDDIVATVSKLLNLALRALEQIDTSLVAFRTAIAPAAPAPAALALAPAPSTD